MQLPTVFLGARLIPVVVIDAPGSAVPLAEALIAGGLPVMEVTFRTASAAEVMNRISRSCPGMLLGAGTVLTAEQVKTAAGCGAKFIVSPGLSVSVVEECRKANLLVIPGAVTPTEIMAAAALGLDLLKFFPAEAAGGVKYLKSVCAPFRNIRFIPTGGVDEKNLGAYLALPQVVACGGSWMVKPELIAAGRFDEITRLTAAAVAIATSPH